MICHTRVICPSGSFRLHLLGAVVGGKIAQWRTQPMASLQLVTTVLMLAVAVGSVR
jgi:hypothetical protein